MNTKDVNTEEYGAFGGAICAPRLDAQFDFRQTGPLPPLWPLAVARRATPDELKSSQDCMRHEGDSGPQDQSLASAAQRRDQYPG